MMYVSRMCTVFAPRYPIIANILYVIATGRRGTGKKVVLLLLLLLFLFAFESQN